MRIRDIMTLLPQAIEHHMNILLVSSPGIGKTSVVKEVTDGRQIEIIWKHPSVEDPTDLKGFGAIDRDTGVAKFYPFEDVHSLMLAKKTTVLFMDDFGQAPASVQAPYMQLLWGRRLNGYVLPDYVSFIIATNDRKDKAGVQGILEPVKSRTTIIHMEADEEDWYIWAYKNDMPPELISFLKWRKNVKGGSLLYDFKPTLDMTNSPCPRTVETVGRWINLNLPKHIEKEVISGCVGEGFAVELAAFLKTYRELPDPDDILANPKKYKDKFKADRPDILYAILGALTHKATKKNFNNVVEFSFFLPEEFAVTLVKDCVMKDVALAETSGFKYFTDKFRHIVV